VNKTNNILEEMYGARENNEQLDMKSTLRDLSFNLNGHLLHSLFWKCMRAPQEDNKPGREIADSFDEYFGSFDRFRQEFSSAAAAVEGSGWMTLLRDGEDNLFVMQVEDHNDLHVAGLVPILVLDVWEHAYYLDYANDRGEFIENWWKVVNWDYVNELAAS
jgi:Fe-Mn family superoxide dismutase